MPQVNLHSVVRVKSALPRGRVRMTVSSSLHAKGQPYVPSQVQASALLGVGLLL